jgi:hypothetical protein
MTNSRLLSGARTTDASESLHAARGSARCPAVVTWRKCLTILSSAASISLVFLLQPAASQECGQCSQITSGGQRSCQAIREPDRYNYCITQVQDAAARCFKVCTNYNGIGPRGNTVR